MGAPWRNTKVKRDKTDDVFSFLVRERAQWFCERCGIGFAHNPGSLHCSHFFGRANQGTRWHPMNAAAHCVGCHDHLGAEPILFAEWVKGRYGEEYYNRLRVMAHKVTKISKFEKELIHKHYLAEKKRLLELRLAGRVGRLEFTYVGG
ncbi:MAG: hypothetical protein AAF542_17955 [Pseudomonadota bacterium]